LKKDILTNQFHFLFFFLFFSTGTSFMKEKSQQEKIDNYGKTDYRKPENLRHLGNASRNRGQSEKDSMAQTQQVKEDGNGKITNR
jgi:hypothetical protein